MHLFAGGIYREIASWYRFDMCPLLAMPFADAEHRGR